MLDTRTIEMKREMAQHFDEFEEDYRDADWCSVIYEDDDVVVLADHVGHEWTDWMEEFDDHEFSEAMHELAHQLTDRRWGSDYPIIFDKFE